MKNLLERFKEDTNVDFDSIEKITFKEFEIDKEKMKELLEKNTELFRVDDNFIFWGKDFNIIILKDDDVYSWKQDYSYFKINYFKIPKIIEKIIPDNLEILYDYEAKDGNIYKVPYKSLSQEEKKNKELIIKLLNGWDELEQRILKETFKELEYCTILQNSKEDEDVLYIVVPEDFILSDFIKKNDKTPFTIYDFVNFEGFVNSLDGKTVNEYLEYNFKNNDIFKPVHKKQKQVFENLLKNKKLYKILGFSKSTSKNIGIPITELARLLILSLKNKYGIN